MNFLREANKNCMNSSFSRNRRIKSLLFFIICILLAIAPHSLNKGSYELLFLIISLVVLSYGFWVVSRILQTKLSKEKFIKDNSLSNLPTLDILVAARDEQNVIGRLVDRLFKLDYPSEKLNIYIIDDGSSDNTPNILNALSKKYSEMQIIKRDIKAGGGKSGALNDALKHSFGEWIFILDADAQLKDDSLIRLLNFAINGSWSAVQLRKSVMNVKKNLLTNCQAIEMAMDASFQIGRSSAAGIGELRGNGQLLKRSVLIQSGLFNEDTVTDDLDVSLRLLLSEYPIGILWNPPVMEEAVENLPALFAQRQRWAEGGLQRFFDYGSQLILGKLNVRQKFDLLYFFLLQYALPIITLLDLVFSLFLTTTPMYWPISLSAFSLSAIASWCGCKINQEEPVLPKIDLFSMLLYLIYLSHWFIVIPLVALKMSIFPKKILWKKTLHKG